MSGASSLEPLPLVSVVVPVYDDPAAVLVLLSALAVQDYPRDRFECVLVDNGSREPVRVPADCGVAVRVLREVVGGSYAARNRGVREARGSVLAFTDADCRPVGDWLSSAVARLCIGGRPLVLGGAIVVEPVGAPASILEWHSIVNEFDQARFVAEYHFAATANMVSSRQVFTRVGDFDGSLTSGGDYEWGRRAWSMGVELVYAPEVVVRHPARTTWQALAIRSRRIIRGHDEVRRREGDPPIGLVVLIARIACAAARRTWRDPRVPTWSIRLRVAAVDGALRFVQLWEVARLWLGRATSSRISSPARTAGRDG
jgi:glycosyltransferase involved in cell wall biosynthesis